MTGRPFDAEAFTRAAEQLKADHVGELAAFYGEDCQFTDPFQSVHGREAIARIYREMFKGLSDPRFLNVRVREIAAAPGLSGRELAVQWDFEFSLKPQGARRIIPGLSILTLNDDHLITRHVDYWDASQLMEELPLIGAIVHWVRKKIAHAV